MNSLLDYVSVNERYKLNSALNVKGSMFKPEIKSDVISVLCRLGCREMPTPMNLPKLITQVAQFEFCSKPAGAISMIHSGIPDSNKSFWKKMGINGISGVYESLTVNSEKVLKTLECLGQENVAEEQIFSYLTTMIGNMSINELRNFLRFTTGSSVCVAKSILVSFDDIRSHPFASTCVKSLILPVFYRNYHEFFF